MGLAWLCVEGGGEVVGRPVGDGDADRGADAGEEEALREHLADQPAAGGAERGADGQLLGPQGGARKLHVHHVDAGDEQNEQAAAQHSPEQLRQGGRRERLDQRLDEGGVEFLVRVGEGDGELLGDGREFSRGLVEGHLALDQAEDGGRRALGIGVVARLRGIFAVEGDPDLLVDGEGEARRHDADDGGGFAVDADALADDIGRTAEIALPELVADERDLGGAGLVIGGGEVAPDDGADAADAEEIGGDVRTGVALRIAVDRDVDGGAVDVSRQQIERLLLLAHGLVVEREDLAAKAVDVRVFLADIDDLDAGEAVGVRIREAAEHGAVDDAEHRRDAPDAEGEDEHGEQAEGLFLEEDAKTDADVLEEAWEEHGGEAGRFQRSTVSGGAVGGGAG